MKKEDKNKFNEENEKDSKKQKEGLNASNISRDVGMNDIIDQIGNLMKKFANEVNVTKDEFTDKAGINLKIIFR